MAHKTRISKLERTLLPIGDIPELHGSLQSARRKFRLPPLAQPNAEDINLSSFLTLMETFPIQVHKHRNQYRCVGNIRIWELCRAWFAPDQKVRVEVHSERIDLERWDRNQLLELFYLNAIFGLTADDCASLHEVAVNWPKTMGLDPLFSCKAAYQRAMRVGKGRMNRG